MEIREKYIDPFTDFGFKKIFGSEPHKDLLIDFLNNLLDGYKRIDDLQYSKNEQIGKNDLYRKAIFDLYCTGPNGERFIIELQRIKQVYFKDRSLYYITFPVQDQAPKDSQWDYRLHDVILVGIMDFTFDDTDFHYRHDVQLIDQSTGKVFYNKLKFIYLEMPKFTKQGDELGTRLEKWMYLLKHLHQFQEIPVILQEKIFRKVFNIAEVAHLSQEDMKQYEKSLKEKWDYYSAMKTVREEGKAEGKIEVARKLKANGMDDEFIAKSTGLSVAEIRKL